MGGRGVRDFFRVGVAFLALGLIAFPASAGAETIKVKNQKDSGKGSLRKAISDALDGDVVKVPKGHYELKEDPLEVASDIQIRGAGPGKTVVDGAGNTRVFFVTNLTSVEFSKLAVTGGKEEFGAGILSVGNVTLDQVLLAENKAKRAVGRSYGAGIYQEYGTIAISRSKVTKNSTTSGDDLAIGGAIYHGGGAGTTLAISRSEISDNTAKGIGGYGGAIAFTPIHSSGATELGISQSTIAGNRALGDADTGYAGALYYEPVANGAGATAALTLENSTVANNLSESAQADAYAGGLGVGALVAAGGSAVENITNSTIAGNEAAGGSSVGGGIFTGGPGVPVVANTIVADNEADAGTEGCSEAVNTADGNMERGTTCGFTDPNDISPGNPKLGDLKDNGGPTPTMALPKNSPAVDEALGGTCPPTDQRNVDRPQGMFCDIGAYELKQP
jgi:hypothetical protein